MQAVHLCNLLISGSKVHIYVALISLAKSSFSKLSWVRGYHWFFRQLKEAIIKTIQATACICSPCEIYITTTNVHKIAYFHNSPLCKGTSKCTGKSRKILLSSEHICHYLDKGWNHTHALKEERIMQYMKNTVNNHYLQFVLLMLDAKLL